MRHYKIGMSVAALSVACGLAMVASLSAGPLSPPPGPVTSTYKTLSEIEPRTCISLANTPGDANSIYRITAPGSYYLCGNITGAAAKHAIEIESDNVTLDLNGFTIQGMVGAVDGINVNGLRRNVFISGGTVRGFPGSGIYAKDVSGGILRDLFVQGNTLDGVWPGSETLVQNVQAISNARHGFVISGRTQVTLQTCQAVDNDIGFQGIDSGVLYYQDCSARENREQGFRSGGESRYVNCHAMGNDLAGFEGGLRNQFTNCLADWNTGLGFSANQVATLSDCRATNNGQTGFSIGSYSTLRGCLALQNAVNGIAANDNSMVIDCEATLNTTGGIVVANGATVERCNSNSNGGVGVYMNAGCTARGNNVRSNAWDGIRVDAACLVVDNHCDGNGSAAGVHGGIRIESGTGNRIEGNDISFCDTSVFMALASAQGNLIVRNTSRSPSLNHFTLSSGNAYGPIVTVTGVGNINAVTNSNHPMANFIY